MSSFEHFKKRKRLIIDKLDGALTSPPKICNGIKHNLAEFNFNVPSKSKPGTMHNVSIKMEKSGEVFINCDCKIQHAIKKLEQGVFVPIKDVDYCTHINAAIVYFFGKVMRSTQKAYDFNQLDSEIDRVTKDFESSLALL